MDHEHAVACDGDVELERGHAVLQRDLESPQGVLGGQAAGAAMALQVQRLGAKGQAGQRQGQHRADASGGVHGRQASAIAAGCPAANP